MTSVVGRFLGRWSRNQFRAGLLSGVMVHHRCSAEIYTTAKIRRRDMATMNTVVPVSDLVEFPINHMTYGLHKKKGDGTIGRSGGGGRVSAVSRYWWS
jgi:hypothetical protein